jgi:hypothetical protein
MSGNGLCLSELCHFVNLCPPESLVGAKVMPTFDMEGYAHATIIVQYGATNADAGFITVEACDNMTPTTHPDFAFRYYAEETASGDVLDATATQAVAATGIDAAPAGVNDIFYVIEIDADELPNGYHCLRVNTSAPGGANLTSAIAILSGGRYKGAASPTVLV